MWSAVPASWDFSVAHGRMYDVEQHVNWKCHINKGKAIGSTLKISHFVGCEMLSSQHLDVIQAEMLFTHFFVVHIALWVSADHVRHLFWQMFLGNRRRTMYIAFKIKLLHLHLILLHLSLVKGWQLWGGCKLNGVWQGEMEMWGCTVNGVWHQQGEMEVYSEGCCVRGRNGDVGVYSEWCCFRGRNGGVQWMVLCEREKWGCTVNGVVWEREVEVYSEWCCVRGRNGGVQ